MKDNFQGIQHEIDGFHKGIYNQKTNTMSLLFWKKKNTGEVIHHSCYDKLPPKHQSFWERSSDTPTHQVDDSGSFGLSFLVGMESGSVLEGSLLGGDVGGAALGALVHDNVVDRSSTEFGGGSGDGGGASGNWDTNNSTSDTTSSDSSSSYDSGSSNLDSGSTSSGSDY